MSGSNRRVIALGNLAGELKTSLEAAARAVGVELLLTREPARAFVELERDGALAVLVDMATLGAEQFCKRARGTERLRSVPVIGMSRHPNELGFARVFAWGADDLVPLGARVPLERRLEVLRDTPAPGATGYGQAVVAEATTQRRALVGRVLAQAGYEVKFAVDRGAVELYASQSETRLVVISAALGDPRRIIEAAAKAGALPTWIVTVEARSTQRLAASLSGLDRVAVTSTAGSPEDVLFLANELVFSKGTRRREWRALYATPVAFRPQGGDSDEYGFSYDASPSGLYVRSLLPCATEEVEVELRLPNRDERVRLTGKVAKRFAFGSGAIASAPPGFAVRLEGPTDALERWTAACSELIAAASTESMPPRPRSPSQPVLQSPGFGAKEVSLAVPPATVSIESVVAPLPTSLQAAVAEGSDVGELLAATLDEQTLTEVGARPVTIDSSGGVREQRPSEFGVSLQGLDPLATPVINDPLRLVPSVPVPSPTPAPVATAPPAPAPEPPREPEPEPLPPREPEPDPPREEPARALGGTVVLEPAVEFSPPSPRSADWDSDAKTEVRGSQPSIHDTEAPAPNAPAAEAEAVPAAPPAAKDEPAKAPFAATVVAPPPPVPRSSPTAGLPPPPARARSASSPELPPGARPRSPSSPDLPELPAPPAPIAAPPTAAGADEPSASPAESPTSSPPSSGSGLKRPSIKKTLPMGFRKQEVPKAPEPPPERAPSPVPPPPASGTSPQRTVAYALAALAALGVGVGAAFVVHSQQGPTSPPERVAAANPPTPTATGVTTATATAAKTAPTTTSRTLREPAPRATAPAVAASLPAKSASAAVAPPVTSMTKAAASATPAPVPTPPPPVSGPAVDLTKLPADRAALIVHSSANTHVFVHGTDYGETNRPLITSCGIRFVRLGRALGDFIEPGQARVIKCGRLTELTIEPAP